MKTLLAIILVSVSATCQSGDSKFLRNFIDDLVNSETIDSEFVLKYYSIDPKITQDQYESGIFPIMAAHLQILKNELDNGKLINISKDKDNKFKEKINLKYDENDGLVYFILIESQVRFPILMKNGRIISSLTKSKSENGTKTFVIY